MQREPISKPSFRTMAFDVLRLVNPALALGRMWSFERWERNSIASMHISGADAFLMRSEGKAKRPFVDEAGGSAHEGLVFHICFSCRPNNRRFLARIDASSGRRQVEDRASLGSRGG